MLVSQHHKRTTTTHTLCNFLPYMSMNPNMSTVDGYTVNSWHVCTFWKSSVMLTAIRSTVDMFFKRLKIKVCKCWWLSHQQMTTFKVVNCWRLSHQQLTCLNFHILNPLKLKHVNCWRLSRRQLTCLKDVICWRLSHQQLLTFIFQSLKKHERFLKLQTCRLLTV